MSCSQRLGFVLCLLLLIFDHACAQQPAALFDAFQGFIDNLVVTNRDTPPTGAGIFVDDVLGKINTMTLRGITNTTAVLYDAHALIATSNTTQLLGYPVSASVVALSIQHAVVSSTVVLSMMYPILNASIPVQTDISIHFNEHAKITAYDISTRRWDAAFGFVAPQLAGTAAAELGLDGVQENTTSILAQRAATDMCGAAQSFCVGDSQQYPSYSACFSALSQEDFSTEFNQCRYLHKSLVASDSSVFCPGLGQSGGPNCALSSVEAYAESVMAFPFTDQSNTMVSVNQPSSGTSKLSAETQEELLKINMREIYPTSVAFYPIPAMLYMLLLYLSGKATEFAFLRVSPVFCQLSFDNRRNTVTYAMNTVYTTVALILQLLATPMLADDYTGDRFDYVRLAALVVTGLYLYELVYRSSMRWPLLVHHFCTIFSVVFLQVVLQMTLNPALASAGLIWIFQATTEQSLFIGLLIYRLRYPKKIVQWTLKFAAVQGFIFKLAFAAYLLVYWGMNLAKEDEDAVEVAFSVILVTCVALLMTTQIYGSWAAWCIAVNMDKKRPGGDKIVGDVEQSAGTAGFARVNKEQCSPHDRDSSTSSKLGVPNTAHLSLPGSATPLTRSSSMTLLPQHELISLLTTPASEGATTEHVQVN